MKERAYIPEAEGNGFYMPVIQRNSALNRSKDEGESM